MNKYNEYGVFLTRAQPFHIGHMHVISEMLKTHKNVLLIIGSANKSGTIRNPFPIKMRTHYAKDCLFAKLPLCDAIRVQIMTLNDWSMENYKPAVKEWGLFLYYNIVNAIGTKNFDIYYNDDISIIEDWFPSYIRERIEIYQIERNSVYDGVSSTKLRNAILVNNKEYATKYLAGGVLGYHELYRELLSVNENPKEDFIM